MSQWQQDQVLAILREQGKPMNSTEISESLPFMIAEDCREEDGRDCFTCKRAEPVLIAGNPVHVRVRGHSTSGHATRILNQLHAAGSVVREKVGRRVMWSLSPDYLRTEFDTTKAAIPLLLFTGIAGPTHEEAEKRPGSGMSCSVRIGCPAREGDQGKGRGRSSAPPAQPASWPRDQVADAITEGLKLPRAASAFAVDLDAGKVALIEHRPSGYTNLYFAHRGVRIEIRIAGRNSTAHPIDGLGIVRGGKNLAYGARPVVGWAT